jgi:uncharacterized membrane protein
MEAKAKLLGHAIHPILIVFPLGLLGTSVIFDLIYLGTDGSNWSTVSSYLIAAGIVGGLVAAPFGWIDWFAIPSGTRAKTIGLTHGLVNTLVLTLFAISLYLRWDLPARPSTIALALSFTGFVLALLGGWLGGELIERLGIAVHPGANPDAPSSLSGVPATATRRER